MLALTASGDGRFCYLPLTGRRICCPSDEPALVAKAAHTSQRVGDLLRSASRLTVKVSK